MLEGLDVKALMEYKVPKVEIILGLASLLTSDVGEEWRDRVNKESWEELEETMTMSIYLWRVVEGQK